MKELDHYSEFVEQTVRYVTQNAILNFPYDQAVEIIMSVGLTLIMNAINEFPLEHREQFRNMIITSLERTTNDDTGSIQ